MASPSTREAQDAAEPTPAGFNHLSLPVKDVDQSVRFFTEVLGAEWVMGQEAFAEVRCGGMIIGLSRQPGGWTAPDAEFPHYGFQIDCLSILGSGTKLPARQSEAGIFVQAALQSAQNSHFLPVIDNASSFCGSSLSNPLSGAQSLQR